MNEEVKNVCIERKIDYLFHFTHISNLNSIMKYGLLSRAALDARRYNYKYTDKDREDGHKNTVSCSIGFPNFKYFYSIRRRLGTTCSDWVVLALERSLLWDKECAFCRENASSDNEKYMDIKNKKGVESFNNMFDNYYSFKKEKLVNRDSLNINDGYPTNPQAEVLVIGGIDLSYIAGGIFCDQELAATLSNRYKDYSFICNGDAFSRRGDYIHWQF